MRLIGANVVGAPTLSTETRVAIAMIAYAPGSLATGTKEARQRAADDAELTAAPSLGDLPLIVLASEQNMTADPNWPEAQRLLAGLSPLCRLIVPAGSGHYIQWEQPVLVIDAVRQVVEQVRGE